MPFFTVQPNGRGRMTAVEAGDLYVLTLLKGKVTNPVDTLAALKRDPGHHFATNIPGTDLVFVHQRDVAQFKAKIADLPQLAARLQ